MVSPRAALAALAVAAAVTIGPGRVRADDDKPVELEMKVVERGKTLYLSTKLAIFDTAAYDRLGNGLETTVIIKIEVIPRGQTRPSAVQLLHRRVVYDLWDEVFVVAQASPGGRRVVKVKYKAEALTLMTELVDVAIADVGAIPYDTQHAVVIEALLNPVSQETLAEVRRWLSQGSGGGLDRGGSFFGSFVSVFVNLKIPDADRIVRARSKTPFFRPRPARKAP